MTRRRPTRNTKVEIICSVCGNTILISKERISRHSGKCLSCSAKVHWLNDDYREKQRKAHLGIIPYSKLEYSESSFKYLYKSYKKGAEKRKLTFNLSEDFFRKITKQNCYYCGREPEQFRKYYGKINGYWIYNGIDRIDNTIGYEESNVVPACKYCNFAKQKLHLNDFLRLVKKIYEHKQLEIYDCNNKQN